MSTCYSYLSDADLNRLAGDSHDPELGKELSFRRWCQRFGYDSMNERTWESYLHMVTNGEYDPYDEDYIYKDISDYIFDNHLPRITYINQWNLCSNFILEYLPFASREILISQQGIDASMFESKLNPFWANLNKAIDRGARVRLLLQDRPSEEALESFNKRDDLQGIRWLVDGMAKQCFIVLDSYLAFIGVGDPLANSTYNLEANTNTVSGVLTRDWNVVEQVVRDFRFFWG